MNAAEQVSSTKTSTLKVTGCSNRRVRGCVAALLIGVTIRPGTAAAIFNFEPSMVRREQNSCLRSNRKKIENLNQSELSYPVILEEEKACNVQVYESFKAEHHIPRLLKVNAP